MAHITNRNLGEGLILTLPSGDEILIEVHEPRFDNLVALHVTAPQDVLIERVSADEIVEAAS